MAGDWERERGGSPGPSEPWGAGDWAPDSSDGRRGPGERSSPSHYGAEHGFGGFQGDYGGGTGQGGFGGQGDYRGSSGRQSFSSGAQHGGWHQDDQYRSWRARQIEQMDRDYQDYCREHSGRFHSDFDGWRQGRQARAAAADAGAAPEAGGGGPKP
jgi:hypothetical protein